MPGAGRDTIDAYALVVIVTLATCERHAQLIRDQHGADAGYWCEFRSDALRGVREVVVDFQNAIYREEA